MGINVDYPAAHSMDSCWFAVDENGEIAAFDTDEPGTIPSAGFAMGGEAGAQHGPFEMGDLLAAALLHRATSDEELRTLLPEDPEEVAACVSDAAWELEDALGPMLGVLGVHFYNMLEWGSGPYARRNTVDSPLRVSDLDPTTREVISGGTLPVLFAEFPHLAPGEFVKVESWSQTWVDLNGNEHSTDHVGGDDGSPAEWESAVAPSMSREEFLSEVAGIFERAAAPSLAVDHGTSVSSKPSGFKRLLGWLKGK